MLDPASTKPRRIIWQNVTTVLSAAVLLGAEVFGAAFAGGWALANLFGIGLYGEYIFLVRCGLFDRILYTDTPLVLYRTHEGAWGVGNVELDKYREAGAELLRRSARVLQRASHASDLDRHLLALAGIHLRYYAAKLGASLAARTASLREALAMLAAEADRIRATLRDIGRPDNERAFLLIPVGYPADEVYVPSLDRKRIEEVAVFYE